MRTKAKFQGWWDTLTNEKKAVFASFVVLILAFSLMGVSMESNKLQINSRGNSIDTFATSLPVEFAAAGDSSTNPTKLKAMVKGSIYENGSNMTVYGACFDGDGFLLSAADTTFTGWYPNGTIMVGPNATMDRIYEDFDNPLGNATNNPNGTGRWKIHVTMGDVIGTYLTEMRCSYGGDFAVAFGEWQNPEWVKRIELTQNTVNSNYALLQQVANDTQNNFSSVISLVNNLTFNISTATSGAEVSLAELEQVLREIDRGYWVLDEKNPFYIIGSGVHQFTAVDMLSPTRVAAVSSDGYYVVWDGETWQETQVSGATFNGVSLLSSIGVFGWAVGDDGADPAYSINGGALVVPTLPGGSPTTFTDVKVFQDPNNPALYYHVVALGDDGSIYQTDDGGSNWVLLGTSMSAGTIGRLSDVVENYISGAPVEGYIIGAVQGDDVAIYDGATVTVTNVPGITFTGIDMMYGDLGYAVGTNSTHTIIYKYNGTAITEEYAIDDSIIVPTGVEMHTQNDVWVTTSNPDVIYHFNGRTWEYGTLGSSQFGNIVVSFANLTGAGLADMSMGDSRSGYAVGADGVIFKFQTQSAQTSENMFNTLDLLNQSLYAVNGSVSQLIIDVNQSVNSYLFDINQSLSTDISNLQLIFNQMNATIDYKLYNILNNVTFTNLYLTTTIQPLLNSTYENTLSILIQLGIIEAQINQTIVLQNTTLGIVNQTAQDVDILLNRSNKIRAWITQ